MNTGMGPILMLYKVSDMKGDLSLDFQGHLLINWKKKCVFENLGGAGEGEEKGDRETENKFPIFWFTPPNL